MVHGAVKQSGRHIIVKSEPDKGSAFTVYLPMIRGEPKPMRSGMTRSPPAQNASFVDDEEAIVEMGEEILAELGYEVTSRMNGREALELLKSDPLRFDLVITRARTMPEMIGIECARGILAARADMPIIMRTGFSYVADADKARAGRHQDLCHEASH